MQFDRFVHFLEDIEEDLPNIKWSAPDIVWPDYKSWSGVGKWTISVISFSIVDQGYPAGSMGYDGTATHDGIVVRLTRTLAEKAFRLAEKSAS